mmetsp:Transcript_4511/g.12987  ORF Transcript_4511/g.12987 Transcript_4511/m.12987 type:complete len:105 (-) Transcript_4511:549-863(-)
MTSRIAATCLLLLTVLALLLLAPQPSAARYLVDGVSVDVDPNLAVSREQAEAALEELLSKPLQSTDPVPVSSIKDVVTAVGQPLRQTAVSAVSTAVNAVRTVFG